MKKYILYTLLTFSFAGVTYADEINIQYKYTMDYQREGKSLVQFQDAFYFPLSQFGKMTSEEITEAIEKDPVVQQMKEARFDALKEVIDNPPAPIEPTKEDLQAQAEEVIKILAQLIDLIAQKDAIDQ